MDGARPIEIATLRELRGIRLRSDIDETREQYATLDHDGKVMQLEHVASELLTIKSRFASAKSTAQENLSKAPNEPAVWREGSISNAKKALAQFEAEEAQALAPIQSPLHVLKGLVQDSLLAEIAAPSDVRDPAAFVMKEQQARVSRRARLSDTEARYCRPNNSEPSERLRTQ